MTEFGPNCYYIDLKIAEEKINSVGHPTLLIEAEIVAADMNEVEPGKVNKNKIKEMIIEKNKSL